MTLIHIFVNVKIRMNYGLSICEMILDLHILTQ